MRALALILIVSCSPSTVSPVEVPPEIDTGCDRAYKIDPPDPAVIEAQYVSIPRSCILKLDDPLMGPRCRSLLDKSLAGYFGEPARLEAIRILGVQP